MAQVHAVQSRHSTYQSEQITPTSWGYRYDARVGAERGNGRCGSMAVLSDGEEPQSISNLALEKGQ